MNNQTKYCNQCKEDVIINDWFTNQEICDNCLYNTKICKLCNKRKHILKEFEEKEVICKDCKQFFQKEHGRDYETIL